MSHDLSAMLHATEREALRKTIEAQQAQIARYRDALLRLLNAKPSRLPEAEENAWAALNHIQGDGRDA